MSYLRRLAELDPRASLLTPVAERLLLLTGQSSFRSAGLRAEQVEFLRAVAPQAATVVAAGFPFHGAAFAPEARPGLLAASLRNALQVAWSFTSRRYQAVVLRTLQRALDTTEHRLLLLTGSCGLHLTNRAWPRLEVPRHLRIRIVALGPACWGRLRLGSAELTVVQGERDRWSRICYRGPVDIHAPCGHLDYWTSPAVRAEVAALLR